ncbi:MAG: hypothetical protein NWQ43_05305 [Dolichospermum sp.]|nr:hypothetical protein [Dolichospermum sp.]
MLKAKIQVIQQESGVRSQESGVKLAWFVGFDLDFVPPNYATCCNNEENQG